MTDIEIPYENERGPRYRFFEMLPGLISWTILLLPFILSQISPRVTVFFIIAFLLIWFAKAVGLLIRNFQGLQTMNKFSRLDWPKLLKEVEAGVIDESVPVPDWHRVNLSRLQSKEKSIKPSDLYHAIIIATHNEAREVLEPTIQYVLDSAYDMKKVILVLAYEERGGPDVEAQDEKLVEDYRGKFKHAMAVKHPKDLPNEVIGKGANITYAARKLEKYLAEEGIDPSKVVVTTLDSDNRPHEYYLPALSYLYCVCPDPLYASFQPIPMFTNNIWDAPAPMRVIATGNSFWNVVLAMRPHMIRNFSSHAQSMAALIKTDYWSVRTIVEDGHQFWRSYFRFDGKHEVYPLYLPIYQDAVLAGTFWKTIKTQFYQLRRWAWGASDVAYVVDKGFFTDNEVPKGDLILKFFRLLEGHISWATAPLILAFAAFIPLLFNPQDIAANQLPMIASRIQTVALTGVIATMFLSLKTLPPKPARYKKHRTIFMVLQWIYLPVTTIVFNSFAALNSQTRLIFGKYVGKFDVTEKAVITESKEKIV